MSKPPRWTPPPGFRIPPAPPTSQPPVPSLNPQPPSGDEDLAYRQHLIEQATSIKDFRGLASYFQRQLDDATLSRLCKSTGGEAEHYRDIGVGYDSATNAWTFPEYNAEGEVVGIALRLEFPIDGRNKSFIPGGQRGLTLKWPLGSYEGTSIDDPILLIEGQTDTACGCGLGCPTIGRPSATLGNATITALRKLLKHRHVVIIAENDWGIGIESATAIATLLLDCAASVRVVIPPSEYKDLRQWYIAGLTKEQLLKAIADTPLFRPISRDIIGKLLQRSEKPPILVPGRHHAENKAAHEIGNDRFADEVLTELPEDFIYRMALTPGRVAGNPGTKRFEKFNECDIRILADEHLRLTRLEESGSAGKRLTTANYVNCNHDLAKLVLAAAKTHPNVQEIKMLVNFPTFTESWKLARPGYMDGLYFDAPPALNGLTPICDPDIIRRALADLVIDFPFASEADRQNFYGLLLTPLVRWAIQGNVPMHLVMASLERTGKTKLVEQVFGGLMLGRAGLPAMQLTNKEDETEKRIVSILREGKTLLNLDNIRDAINSPSLASLLTARVFAGRVLGVSQTTTAFNYLTIIGTGNSITASGEIAKRSIPIYLQPQSANPEDRNDFEHPDLPKYIQFVRKHVLGCLVGMVINWVEDGRVPSSLPLGGFEQWAQTIGGILEMHGYTAWRTNERDWRRTADPFGEDLLSFVWHWWAMHNCEPVAPKTLLALAENHSLFTDLLAGKGQQGKLMAFSKKVLGQLDNRPIGDCIIRRRKSGNNTTYLLEKAPNAPTQ